MKYIIALLLLVPLSFAATPALDAEYLTIVGADAPVTDVLTAANFAATIKQVGLTFTGATDADALGYYAASDLADHYFVVIDGKSVTLLGEERYAQQIEDYFRDQGFRVTVKTTAELEDLAVTAQIPQQKEEKSPEVLPQPEPVVVLETNTETEETVPEPIVPPPCTTCMYNGQCYETGAVVAIDNSAHYCDGQDLQPRKEKGASCKETYECAAGESCGDGTCGEKQNVFARLFTWFGSFF